MDKITPTIIVIVFLIGFLFVATTTNGVEKKTLLKPSKIITKPTRIPKKVSQWSIQDDGNFLTVESSVYKAVFAYGGKANGWFMGAPTTGCNRTDSQTGGGGCDGAIVELYYIPTDPAATRNLVFRNGTWGSGYDGLDIWEAEVTGETQGEFDNPDYSSNRHGKPLAFPNGKFYQTKETKGKLSVLSKISFFSWEIIRTYEFDDSNKITLSATISVIKPGNYYYLGHRFNIAGNEYSFQKASQKFTWGNSYQKNGGSLVAWSDGVDHLTGQKSGEPKKSSLPVIANAQKNTIGHSSKEKDSYSGFMLDSTDDSAPDIIVMNGHPNDWVSPFSSVSRKIGPYYSYVETAMYSFDWAPSNETQVGMTWFYMTSDYWKKPGYWSSNLGSWKERFYIILAKGSAYTGEDYGNIQKSALQK